MMKFSLLYGDDRSRDAAASERGSASIYNLSIDKSFAAIYPDTRGRRYFLSVLSDICPEPDEAVMRQSILRDFINSPSLYDSVVKVFSRLEPIRDDWEANRRKLYSLKRTNIAATSLDDNRALTVITASYLKKTLVFIKSVGDLIDPYPDVSPPLASLFGYCRGIAESDGFAALAEIADECEAMTNETVYDAEVAIDGALRYTLTRICVIENIEADARRSGSAQQSVAAVTDFFSRFKRKAPAPAPDTDEQKAAKVTGLFEGSVRVRDMTDCDAELITEALASLEAALSRVMRAVFDIFADIPHELTFYDVALAYVSHMKFKGAAYCFPELLPSGECAFSCDSLRDLYLLTSLPRAESVVPNSIELADGGKGVLVRGKNNSGKTVFLRSLGTAQILAQSGLPIPAASARISMRTGVFTSFAHAEKESTTLDAAGRFEEEVKEIADIIDAATPCSLVMFNETFQTTSYDEGAEGLRGILEYIAASGSFFIAVSHLTKLFELYGGDDRVLILRTSEGYKVEVDENRTA